MKVFERVLIAIVTVILVLSLVAVAFLLFGGKGGYDKQYDLGVRYVSEGDYKEAILAFEAAIDIDPKKPDAYLALADVYIKTDEPDMAETVLRDALEVTGDDARIEQMIERLPDIVEPEDSDGAKEVPDATAAPASVDRNIAAYTSTGYWHLLDGTHNGQLETICNADGEPLEVRSYDWDGDEAWHEYYQYDGNTRTGVYYSGDGSSSRRDECTYDDRGNLLEETYYNPDGSVFYRYEYEYDAADNMLNSVYYGSDGKVGFRVEFEYDAAGGLLRRVTCGPDANVENWTEYENDAEGKALKATWYDNEGNITDWIDYEYDAEGRLLKEKYCYPPDGNGFWNEYEYDAAGQLIRKTEYGEYDSGEAHVNNWAEFEYDAEGRRIVSRFYGEYRE